MRAFGAILLGGLHLATACATDEGPDDDVPADGDGADGETDGADDDGDGTGPTELVLTLRGVDGTTSNADFVAFQDGDGAWTAVAGNGGVYRASATDERYGFIVVCASTTPFRLRSGYFATVADTSEIEMPACQTRMPMRMLSGSVTGPTNLSNPTVATTYGSWSGNVLGDYSLVTVPGELDVIASAQRSDGARVMARKQTTGAVLDFDLTGAAVAPLRTLNVTGLASGETVFAQSWIERPEGVLPLTTTRELRALELPASLARPGDQIVFRVGASRTVGTQSISRGASGGTPTLALPAARTFAPPDANLVVGVPEIAAGESINISIRTADLFSFQYATKAWLGDAVQFAFVDPTEADGWQPAWNQPRAWTDWSAGWSRFEGITSVSSTTSGPR